MIDHLVAPTGDAVPLVPLRPDDLSGWLDAEPESVRRWVTAAGFAAKSGETCPVPGEGGAIARALAGVGQDPLWDWGGLPNRLPAGSYRIEGDVEDPDAAALGWALGCYVYDRYKSHAGGFASLVWPDGCDARAVDSAVRATGLVRDLINTPANDMGPPELAAAARAMALDFGADCRVIEGDDLLAENFPAIHAVGRAAAKAPRLIDIAWGDEDAPRLAICGKGVCFDTGGLDLKPASGMMLMKKDMGGGANALGLARMVMAGGLKTRLRVLIPAVENSVAGNAMRPLDVVETRKGLTVEIGNTDAEGRVVLSDALYEASADKPALLIDFATLTGAARVALGAELPALFSNDDALAAEAVRHGMEAHDPLWHMPLWQSYRCHLDSKVADLNNTSRSPHGGAITAALFLESFVGEGIPWIHVDQMAWNGDTRPGRPEGGEAMGMRALYAVIAERFR